MNGPFTLTVVVCGFGLGIRLWLSVLVLLIIETFAIRMWLLLSFTPRITLLPFLELMNVTLVGRDFFLDID